MTQHTHPEHVDAMHDIVVDQIERWSDNHNENGSTILNELFLNIIEHGKRIDRSPLLVCSGKYECCYLYNGIVYENWINWGFDELFRLNKTNLNAKHQDREGRIGETYNVDLTSAHTNIIRNTDPLN